MAASILHRRGSTDQVNSYTGPSGEIVINTDEKTIHVQDGSTPGGITIAKYSDIPTKVSELVNDANFTQFAGASATVDANIGTPSVTVTESGSGNNKGLVFSFKNLKGMKGDKGDTGAKGDKGDAGTAYITKVWSNDTSWYRKYSDGWIEQGGRVSSSLITLNTAFSSNNYTLVFGIQSNKNHTAVYGYIGCQSKSNASFTAAGANNDYITAKYWYACGK